MGATFIWVILDHQWPISGFLEDWSQIEHVFYDLMNHVEPLLGHSDLVLIRYHSLIFNIKR